MSSFLKVLVLICICAAPVVAQVAPAGNPNQADLLKSSDPKLAANKKLVYDLWREVHEARHMDLADKYYAEDFIQHNPNLASGRKAFTEFFAKTFGGPKDIAATVQRPLIAVLAEGDLVTMVFANGATSAFDMFRVVNGKVVEHWDANAKR